MLFFLHIPKTAGSTLNYIIKNNYRERAREIRWHWTTWLSKEELRDRLRKLDLSDSKLIHGHFVYGIHELVEKDDSKYVAFVRDPLSKALSGYYHIKRDTKANFHADYASGSVDGYLLDDRILENDNSLTRRLSGVGDGVPYGKVTKIHFNEAIENINKRFVSVGITEQFDESIELFRKLGVISKVYYWRQNVGSKRSANDREKPSESTVKRFREQNRLDYQLYTYCVEQFGKQKEGLKFSQSLFNIKNRLYNFSLLPTKILRKLSRLLGS